MKPASPFHQFFALLFLFVSADASERPPVTQPLQTSGDQAVQPAWQETLTVTVGNQDADISGGDQRPTQAAVDHVARLGGGTVHISSASLGGGISIQMPKASQTLAGG